jgi:hypothetical protein
VYWKLLARDLGIAAVAVGIWIVAAPRSAGAGVVADFTGVVAGLLVGACAYLAHEWGHLLGALASGSVVRRPTSLRSRSLFDFDAKRNSRAQFLAMSFPGFAATALALWVVYALLPSDLLATRVARGAVVFLAFLGLVLEVPLVVYSLVSHKVPPLQYEPKRPAQIPTEREAA